MAERPDDPRETIRQKNDLHTARNEQAVAKARAKGNGPADDFATRGDDEARPGAPPDRFELLTVEDFIGKPRAPALVADVLPLGEVCVLFGESNTYKSFLAIDLLGSVATGTPWHGLAVTQGPVVIVVTEGAQGVGEKRIPGWLLDHGIPREQWQHLVRIIRVPVLLNRPDDVEKLVRTLVEGMPVKPVLVVFDLLAGSMEGAEGDLKDIGPWVRDAHRLSLVLGCTLLHVTHSGYSAAGRARGHSHLWGSFWTRLQAIGNGDDKAARTVLLKVERHKDWDDTGKQWPFRMAEIPVLEPGETTLVPRLIVDKTEAENVAKAAVAGVSKRTGGRPSIEGERARRWFLDALDMEAEAVPASRGFDGTSSVRKVSVQAVHERMKRRGWLDTDDDGKSVSGAGRKRFERAKDDLLAERKIFEGDGLVWRP